MPEGGKQQEKKCKMLGNKENIPPEKFYSYPGDSAEKIKNFL